MRRFVPFVILVLAFAFAVAAEAADVAALFERATRDQLGVIGEDFRADVRIGTAKNKHGYEPVDAHKRTFSGLLTSLWGNGKYAVDDWNFGLQMIGENALVRANLTRLASKKPLHPLGELNGAADFKGSKPGSPGYLKYSPSLPVPMIDAVGMYGPWVFRRRSGKTSIEIHPVNQLWWTTKASDGRRFHLLILNDLSGRFAHYDDYDGVKNHESPWLGGYRAGALGGSTFAVAYEARGKTRYELSAPSLHRPRLSQSKRRTHALDGAGSTASVVEEVEDLRDVIDVSVVKDPSDRKRGFIVIRTKYLGPAKPDGTPEAPGMLSFLVSQHATAPKLPKRVRVTLDSIHCLGADDSGGVEELIGYVGVRATFGGWPALANVVPKRGSPLLWSARDDNLEGAPLRLGKNQAKGFARSVEYELAHAATITLVADLDEDDDSGDKNVTKLDADDDRLEKACKACFRNVPVKDLVPRKPLPVEFAFGSGGTRVAVRLTVEAL